ncbi:hypothetical protein OAD50_00455 [Vicingaceae bacterium]|nr:hypothetical protein [Vicingaceae bacterium]
MPKLKLPMRPNIAKNGLIFNSRSSRKSTKAEIKKEISMVKLSMPME